MQFVVVRDVPVDPSFVVIPGNDYLYEVTYANKIERILIGSGVKVVLRPATKEIKTEQAIQQVENEQASVKTLTERYFMLDEIKADYIVQTYQTSKQVKISKKETGEILTVLLIPDYHNNPQALSSKEIIFNALLRMGILNVN